MSCGQPHDKDCDEVLVQLYRFIDDELDRASCAEIQQHLDECAPCLQHHELDLLVQRLVARSCTDRAPDALRERVLHGLRAVVARRTETSTTTDPTGTRRTSWQQTTHWEGPLTW